ncbi:uncharacterized protein LOC130591064 [Beta vulgaris subsp. vulgaris]|uniref:uncharacterized protein LOC130591064 n=1 Tax=Beta vulgaris subsp. vulgaris TaxID=3555 RepID=UPI00254929C5|nr:uncharacterized protein LOC130591064 [Beta vulgaris subsp. vulgaris]
MDGYFRRVWGKLGINKIAMVGKGLFIVRFDSLESCLKVTTSGFMFFDQKPLITKLWDPDMSMDKDNVSTVPILIKLPQLPFKYWGERSLFKIAGMVGTVVKMDQATKGKEKLSFVRVMVEVGINDALPDSIAFCNQHGNRMEQKVEYEWRPIQCTQCKGFGHELEACRNKGGKKIWVKKGEVVKDKDGFQQIGVRNKSVR